MINSLFRLKRLFGFKVNLRVEVYFRSHLSEASINEIREKLKAHYKTDNVFVICGFDKECIEVTYY